MGTLENLLPKRGGHENIRALAGGGGGGGNLG